MKKPTHDIVTKDDGQIVDRDHAAHVLAARSSVTKRNELMAVTDAPIDDIHTHVNWFGSYFFPCEEDLIAGQGSYRAPATHDELRCAMIEYAHRLADLHIPQLVLFNDSQSLMLNNMVRGYIIPFTEADSTDFIAISLAWEDGTLVVRTIAKSISRTRGEDFLRGSIQTIYTAMCRGLLAAASMEEVA
jgi:hypothetical protein